MPPREQLIYKRIEDEIKSRILSGVYPPGSRLPTERALVEEFDTSRLTVAKSLASLIADGYIVRTRGRGSFVCDPLPDAQTVPEGNSDWIRFISPGYEAQGNFIRTGLLEGLYETVTPAGFNVGVNFYNTPEEERELLRSRSADCRGMAIWPIDRVLLPELYALQEKHLPFVLVDCYFPELVCDHVLSDNAAGAEMMIDHLASLGHREIIYLSAQSDRTSLADRLAGVISGFSRHGISISDGLELIPEAEVCLESIRHRLETRFARPRPPTAIFCSHDYIAILVLEQLEEMGIHVPGEVSVAGFDNIDRSSCLPVPLTTIAQDFFEIGRIAGRILVRQNEDPGNHPSLATQCRVTPRLLPRASTAPLR